MRYLRTASILFAAAGAGACFSEINLAPQAVKRATVQLPMTARVEVTESRAGINSVTPIAFDVRAAASGYFLQRRTFREIVRADSDVVLTLDSRFKFSSQVKFVYAFDMDAELTAKGRVLGRWKTKCSAEGGAIRLTKEADRKPMNAALTECLDSIAEQIEDNATTITDKLNGAPPPAAVASAPAPAAAPASAPAAFVSSADRPGYRLAESPDDFALVIGIEKYDGLPPADYAEHDADAVREHLLALGYPARNIIHITGPKASRTGIEKYVETWLPMNVKPESRVFVYFSGHGAPDTKDGEAYLVPWDGDAKFLKNTGYPLKKLYASLGALKARQVVVAMDACFTGGGGRSVLAKGARPLVPKVDLDAGSSSKLVILAAAAADEITSTAESERHGLFTFQLLKALSASGGRADVQELFDGLKPKVQDEARRDGREQTPQLIGAAKGVELR